MMLDSCVDMYILKEEKLNGPLYESSELANDKKGSGEEQEVLLVRDIASKFDKCAGDRPDLLCQGLVSKVHELNDDLYVSYDIQGYSCKPEKSIGNNPLQYVVSLNPPLMLTNYCMAPLDIYEIDEPKQEILSMKKRIAQIAPAMSSYLFQLDLSNANKSDIFYQFYDTQSKSMISHLFDKFNMETETNQNKAEAHNESEYSRVYFKRHATDEEFQANVDAKGDQLQLCQMTIETVKKLYNKENESYSENFEQRARLIDISLAIKQMIYPDYMIVNRTEKLIQYHGVTVQPRQNDFLLTAPDMAEFIHNNERIQKLKFTVNDFTTCEPFEIGKIGASFIRELDPSKLA